MSESIYFKVVPGSETEKRFEEVKKRTLAAFDQQKALADKHGFSAWRKEAFHVWGRITSVMFDEPPTVPGWRKIDEKEKSYAPDMRTKAGKLIQSDLDGQDIVNRWATNECVGLEGEKAWFYSIGYGLNEKENTWVFSVGAEWGFTPKPDEHIEITHTEYRRLLDEQQ